MVENEFDEWCATLNSKQKKILEKFSFGLIAKGEERGRKEGVIAELENVLEKSIWISNKDDLLVMHMPELRQYLRNRLKELGGNHDCIYC